MKVNDIIKVMEKHYPLNLQEEWDNCGLQLGKKQQDVYKIMISLNADEDTIDEAIKKGCQMLITHHPFLFSGLKCIDYDDVKGRCIYKAIEHHLVIYSSHTALDKVSMNNWLMECLDVQDIHDGDITGITKIGTLKKSMTEDAFLQYVKEIYHLEHFQCAGHAKCISKIGICGGSGSEFIDDMAGVVDAFLTGDTKFHQAQEAIEKNLLLVDIHHYAENIMVKRLKELLEKELDVEIIEGTSPDYYRYY